MQKDWHMQMAVSRTTGELTKAPHLANEMGKDGRPARPPECKSLRAKLPCNNGCKAASECKKEIAH